MMNSTADERRRNRARIEIRNVEMERVVFLDGERMAAFHVMSDDFAYTHASEYAEDLLNQIREGRRK